MSDLPGRLDRLPLCRPHYHLLAIGGLGLTFDGLDVAMMAFVLPPVGQQWGLSGTQLGLLGSSTLIGYLFGAVGAGVLSDRIGRRRVMMYALAVYCLATLVAAFSPNWLFLFACRVVAGVGTGAESVVIPTFLSEFVPGRVRGRLIGALAGFFSFGYVLAALLGRLVIATSENGWRIAHIAAAPPILLLLWWRRSVPESPRFLLAAGRPDAAAAVVEDLERRVARRVGTLPPPPPATPAAAPDLAVAGWRGLAALWGRGLAGRTATVWFL